MAYNSYIQRSKTGNMIPMQYVDEIFKVATENSVVMSLARRLRDMETNQVALTVTDALPTAYFVNGDNGSKQVTVSEWKGVTVKAEELAAIVPVPEAVFEDANVDLWAEIKPQLGEAIGSAIDAAVLLGTNQPSTWLGGDGIAEIATTKSHVVTVPGSSPDYYDLLMGENGIISKVENDGYFVNGHVAGISLRGKLRGIRDEVGQPIFTSMMQAANSYMLDGVPVTFPRNGALNGSTILDIAGDWNQLVYSIRKDITFKAFDQGVITDPSNSNVVVTNLMQQDMIALRVVIRCGFALPNPANRVQPNAASRFPFAVLKDAQTSA